jgi:hypothetical protein
MCRGENCFGIGYNDALFYSNHRSKPAKTMNMDIEKDY